MTISIKGRSAGAMGAMMAAGLLLSALPVSAQGTDERAAATGPQVEGDNILLIGRGGIANPDGVEEERHWSTYTINLLDGSAQYGWLSNGAPAMPLTLGFELAGPGMIYAVVLDNRLQVTRREDGGLSQSGEGAPVRKFALLGATTREGPFETLVEAEAGAEGRTVVPLPKAMPARYLRLRIDSNWAGAGTTRLSELEVLGELQGLPPAGDSSGIYMHEYGPILIRQQGDEIRGCYNDGLGVLRGTVFGRVMRLAWHSLQEGSIGAATLIAANGRLHGFWYRPDDRMGSPWNAVRQGSLPAKVPASCRAALGL